jgi:hypothetical protein
VAAPPASAPANKPVVPPANGGAINNPNAPKFSSLSLSDAQIGGASKLNTNSPGEWDDEGDAWDDDDFGGGGGGGSSKPSSKSIPNDDDFFSTFASNKPAKTVSGMGMSTSRPAPKLQSSGLKVKKTPKPAVKKLTGTSLDDGWDDF